MRASENRWGWPTVAFLVVLVTGPAVRFYFADVNSYWLDELYSVTVYETILGARKACLNRLWGRPHPEARVPGNCPRRVERPEPQFGEALRARSL